ncbi:MAG: heat shock protein transcriptional repressor HspR [Candidatus Aquicultorales bacterium]
MDDEPLFMIGIAAKLAGVHPQTLRIYERKQLVCPSRTKGSTRLYSQNDIERLKLIQELTQELGMNLAGVQKVFELTNEMEEMRTAIDKLRDQLDRARVELSSLLDRSPRTDLVPLPKGSLVLRYERVDKR